MRTTNQLALVITAALVLATGPAVAADLAKGKKVFNKCKACHSLVAGKKKIGPSLHAMFGRTAGTVKKYKYSKAMIAAGKERNIVWDEKTLDTYLLKPKEYIPKTKMAFPGLKKSADRDDLIAYLKDATK